MMKCVVEYGGRPLVSTKNGMLIHALDFQCHVLRPLLEADLHRPAMLRQVPRLSKGTPRIVIDGARVEEEDSTRKRVLFRGVRETNTLADIVHKVRQGQWLRPLVSRLQPVSARPPGAYVYSAIAATSQSERELMAHLQNLSTAPACRPLVLPKPYVKAPSVSSKMLDLSSDDRDSPTSAIGRRLAAAINEDQPLDVRIPMSNHVVGGWPLSTTGGVVAEIVAGDDALRIVVGDITHQFPAWAVPHVELGLVVEVGDYLAGPPTLDGRCDEEWSFDDWTFKYRKHLNEFVSLVLTEVAVSAQGVTYLPLEYFAIDKIAFDIQAVALEVEQTQFCFPVHSLGDLVFSNGLLCVNLASNYHVDNWMKTEFNPRREFQRRPHAAKSGQIPLRMDSMGHTQLVVVDEEGGGR